MIRRRHFLFAFFFFLTIVLIGRAQSSFAKDRVHPFVLDNGMKVILGENRTVPVVALQIWVRVGSGDENDEESGICHFIEHMLFKGTEKRKVREMAREIELLGGTINAYTSYDQTVYHIAVSSRYADTGLDILSDAIEHSIFDPLELEREREVILEEIRRGQDDPSRRLFNQTMASRFLSHPYRRPITGSEKTIRAITRDQMVSFFRKWYVPNRMVFIATGDFNEVQMERKIKEAFERFRPSPGILPQRIEEPEPDGVRIAISGGNLKETYLHIAVPIPSAKHEDVPALDALSHILGGGEASRLVQKVRLEKGLVHSISASSYTFRDHGLFVIGAALPAENVEGTIEAVLAEVTRLKQEGVTAEELHHVKVNAESGQIYNRQTVQGLARKMGYYEVITGGIQFEKEYLRSVSVLQKEDIQEVLEKYFKTSQFLISILTPNEKCNFLKSLPLKEVLEKNGLDESVFPRRTAAGDLRVVLDNGIRVIVKENRSTPLISIQASFLGGVRLEEEHQNGINHFIALMLTKGTQGGGALQIAKKVEGMAGFLNGFSGYNSLGLTFTFLSQHFEEAFGLFAEIIKRPSFPVAEMEKRRPSILASIRLQEDNLSTLTFRSFQKALYEKHPYRMDILGSLDSVQRLTQEDLKDYYQRVAVTENMVLTVVGDVDAKEAISSAAKAFGDLKRGSFVPPAIPEEPSLQNIRRSETYKKKEQAHFLIGFLGASFHDKDRYALEVLEAGLSAQGGRLFHELRDKESLAYALTFSARPNLDKGYIGLYMGTHPEKLEKAMDRVLGELKKVKEEGLTEEEVERAKKYLIGNFEIGLQTNAAQANQISLDELYGLGHDHYRRYPQTIKEISREDVNRVVRKYLNMEGYAVAIIRSPVEKE